MSSVGSISPLDERRGRFSFGTVAIDGALGYPVVNPYSNCQCSILRPTETYLPMAKISFVPHNRTNSNGMSVLMIRCTHDYERKFISLDIKINPKYWNQDQQRVTSSHVSHARINTRLAEMETKTQEVISLVETSPSITTAEWMKEEMTNKLGDAESGGPDAFMEFAFKRLENYKRQGQTGTHKNYQSNLNKFQDFLRDELGREDIHFQRLNDSLIREFRTYCYEVRDNKTNTVGKALTVLRTFVRKAMKEGHITEGYPFEHITVDHEKVEKDKLTPGEIEKIAELELDSSTLTAEIRRWFLFAYYAGGMRFSDVATLKPEHIRSAQGSDQKRIYYRMEKTEGMTGVPITEEAQEILDHYDQTFDPWVFPILQDVEEGDPDLINKKESKNSLANNYLKQYIAPKAGIGKHVSFHLSRNAAAWRLYKSIGDIYKVMKILGHSSVTQTEEYIAGFEDDSLDDDFLDAF